jgi:hypothetical protein
MRTSNILDEEGLSDIERFEYAIMLEILRELAKDEYDVNLAGQATATMLVFKHSQHNLKRRYLGITIRFYSGTKFFGLRSHEIVVRFDDSTDFAAGSKLRVIRIEDHKALNDGPLRFAVIFELADPQCFELVFAHLKDLLNQPWITRKKRKLSKKGPIVTANHESL